MTTSFYDKEIKIVDEDTFNLKLNMLIELRDNINDQIQFFSNLQNFNSKIINDIHIAEQQNLDKYLSIIDMTLIDDYNEICKVYSQQLHLENLNKYVTIINNNIYNRCNHIWIEDNIDITPHTSYKLVYCNNCKLQHKNV